MRGAEIAAVLSCPACQDPVVATIYGVPTGQEGCYVSRVEPKLDPPGMCPNCGGGLKRDEVAP